MSFTFTKLFSSITSSTIWVEDPETKVVWITMLAMADKHGRVFASIPGLAKDAVVSVESTRRAIAKFLAPDPDSRTTTHEGRRIQNIDGGWVLLNHAKYRAIRDEEDHREYKRDHQAQRRARLKQSPEGNPTAPKKRASRQRFEPGFVPGQDYSPARQYHDWFHLPKDQQDKNPWTAPIPEGWEKVLETQ